MQYKIIPVVMMSACLLCLSSCQNRPPENNNNVDGIDLNDLSAAIEIPESANNTMLTRGAYTYELAKKALLRNKRYIVYMTDVLSFTAVHKAAPEDAYSRTLEIVPADDKCAVRAIKNFKTGSMEIKTPQDMARAQQMIADTTYLNSAKFSVGILPADSSVKTISKRLKAGDIIKVSGIRLKHAKVINNNKHEPLTHCLSVMDVFYLTELGIENN